MNKQENTTAQKVRKVKANRVIAGEKLKGAEKVARIPIKVEQPEKLVTQAIMDSRKVTVSS